MFEQEGARNGCNKSIMITTRMSCAAGRCRGTTALLTRASHADLRRHGVVEKPLDTGGIRHSSSTVIQAYSATSRTKEKNRTPACWSGDFAFILVFTFLRVRVRVCACVCDRIV